MHPPIRRIGPDAFSSLSLHSFRCTPGVGDAHAVEAAIRDLTAEELQDNGSVLFAALDGQLTVGVAVVTPVASRPGIWHIPVLAVRVPWQDKGLGRALKHACLAAAHAAHGHRVISSVNLATGYMHRINQTTAGAEWAAEESAPGVFYSIDLAVWAAAYYPDQPPRLPIDLPPRSVKPESN